MPLFADELQPGQRFETAGRTIGESDITRFAGLVGDFTPVHMDEPFARSQGWPGRIAHGPMSVSVAIGLFAQMDVLGTSVIGALSTEWQFLGPVRIGDTIRAVVTVESARVTRKPDRGVAVFAFAVADQDARPVLEGKLTVMMKTRGHG